MRLIFGSCSRSETGCGSSLNALLAGVSDKPFKPLDFWHLATHDRKTLVERIAPYMVARLPEAYLMRTVVAEHGWSCGVLSPGSEQAEDWDITCWQQVATEFWENPSHTTEKLLKLARAWFYTLIRYIYRMRFSARGRRCWRDLIVGDTNSCVEAQYIAGLTELEIHQLIGIPNKYGATFYRSCYRDVRRCSSWTSFSARISSFCKLIHFPTYSDCPEIILTELGGNLPSVILQRRWVHTATRLAETSHLAIGTANYTKKLDAKVASECSFSIKRMKKIEQELEKLHAQYKRLSQTSKTMVECQRSIAALEEQMKKDRVNLGGTHAFNHAFSSLESLIACRWLLENLPVTTGTQKGFAVQWRSFWKFQWSQYDDSVEKNESHPIRKLKHDKKYNVVGKNLYSTLSTILHGYGHLGNVSLHPDVQTMVKAIGPIHYFKDKRIDIEAERGRWLTGNNEVLLK